MDLKDTVETLTDAVDLISTTVGIPAAVINAIRQLKSVAGNKKKINLSIISSEYDRLNRIKQDFQKVTEAKKYTEIEIDKERARLAACAVEQITFIEQFFVEEQSEMQILKNFFSNLTKS